MLKFSLVDLFWYILALQHFAVVLDFALVSSFLRFYAVRNVLILSALSQGRILKHAGDPVAAAALVDEARTMDLADRFLNSECVKRMLQADQVFVVDSDNFSLEVIFLDRNFVALFIFVSLDNHLPFCTFICWCTSNN